MSVDFEMLTECSGAHSDLILEAFNSPCAISGLGDDAVMIDLRLHYACTSAVLYEGYQEAMDEMVLAGLFMLAERRGARRNYRLTPEAVALEDALLSLAVLTRDHKAPGD